VLAGCQLALAMEIQVSIVPRVRFRHQKRRIDRRHALVKEVGLRVSKLGLELGPSEADGLVDIAMVDGSGSKSEKDGAVVPCVLPYRDSTLASDASPHGMGVHDSNPGTSLG
jgi:hypothetical protein